MPLIISDYSFFLVSYMRNIIEAFLFFILFEILWIYLLRNEKKTLTKIGLCDDVQKANEIRIHSKKKRKRVIYSVVIVAGIVLTTVVWYITEGKHFGSWLVLFLMMLFMLVAVMMFFFRKLTIMEGHIEPMSLEDFWSHPRSYGLFLRGFRSDELEIDEWKIESAPNRPFSELHYVKDFEKHSGIKMYAVGNPKELDSPHGAQRIYLDNDNWQQEVLRLMQNAREIHIRVCNTLSCLWELQMVKVMLKKVTLVVDDMEAYNAIRDSVEIGLPNLGEDLGWTFYVLEYDDANGWKINRKKLTSSGYESVTNITDKGKPYKEHHSIGGTIGIYLMLGMCIIVAPDLVMWGELMHEVDEILESRYWTGGKWVSQINGKCPIVIDSHSVLHECNVDQHSFLFKVDIVGEMNDDSIFYAKDMCEKVLDVVFINKNKYTEGFKNAFFDAVYKNYEYIRFDFVMKNRILSTISLTEDDMIELGQLHWHIPSHRSREEEWQIIKENRQLPVYH